MSELTEKTMGSAGAVCLFGLFSVWIVDLELYYKLLATFLVGFLVVGLFGILLLKRWRLIRTRQEQLHRHRNGNSVR
ncbi:hypothetical protein LP7551_00013 [Roseibium album]|nr:hypothetical protein LP7551_00013 [Roseibium album]